MPLLKSVGIKDLKNNLSAYLREVRRGTRILVSDRDTVVAELHEPGASYPGPERRDARLAEWIREGVVSPPSRERSPLPVSPIALEAGTALRLLGEDRSDRKE